MTDLDRRSFLKAAAAAAVVPALGALVSHAIGADEMSITPFKVQVSDDEIADLGIPATDTAGQVDLVRDRLDRVPSALRAAVERVVETFAAAWLEPPADRTVLLHNDFHLLNMVLTTGAGELSGAWDFGCVQVGPPGLDLRYFARVPQSVPLDVRHDLLHRLADQYGRTGITLDVEAARAAMAMEDLVDGVLTDDPRKIEAATDPG